MAVQTLKPLVTQKADCLPESGHFSGVVRGVVWGVVWGWSGCGLVEKQCSAILWKISFSLYRHLWKMEASGDHHQTTPPWSGVVRGVLCRAPRWHSKIQRAHQGPRERRRSPREQYERAVFRREAIHASPGPGHTKSACKPRLSGRLSAVIPPLHPLACVALPLPFHHHHPVKLFLKDGGLPFRLA